MEAGLNQPFCLQNYVSDTLSCPFLLVIRSFKGILRPETNGKQGSLLKATQPASNTVRASRFFPTHPPGWQGDRQPHLVATWTY